MRCLFPLLIHMYQTPLTSKKKVVFNILKENCEKKDCLLNYYFKISIMFQK